MAFRSRFGQQSGGDRAGFRGGFGEAGGIDPLRFLSRFGSPGNALSRTGFGRAATTPSDIDSDTISGIEPGFSGNRQGTFARAARSAISPIVRAGIKRQAAGTSLPPVVKQAGLGQLFATGGGAILDRLTPGAGSDRDTRLQLASLAGAGGAAGEIVGNVGRGLLDTITGNMGISRSPSQKLARERTRHSDRSLFDIHNSLPEEQRNTLFSTPVLPEIKQGRISKEDTDRFIDDLQWRAQAVADIKNNIENAWLGDIDKYGNLEFIPQQDVDYTIDTLELMRDGNRLSEALSLGGMGRIIGGKSLINSTLFSFSRFQARPSEQGEGVRNPFSNPRNILGEILPVGDENEFSYTAPSVNTQFLGSASGETIDDLRVKLFPLNARIKGGQF